MSQPSHQELNNDKVNRLAKKESSLTLLHSIRETYFGIETAVGPQMPNFETRRQYRMNYVITTLYRLIN